MNYVIRRGFDPAAVRTARIIELRIWTPEILAAVSQSSARVLRFYNLHLPGISFPGRKLVFHRCVFDALPIAEDVTFDDCAITFTPELVRWVGEQKRVTFNVAQFDAIRFNLEEVLEMLRAVTRSRTLTHFSYLSGDRNWYREILERAKDILHGCEVYVSLMYEDMYLPEAYEAQVLRVFGTREDMMEREKGYTIVDELGEGADGIVHAAEKDGVQYAIKYVYNAEKELKVEFAMRRCGECPYVSRILDVVMNKSGNYGLVMNRFDGPLLGSGIDPEQAVMDIMLGLEFLAKAGYSHNDIAWRNLGEYKGHAIVYDFGRAEPFNDYTDWQSLLPILHGLGAEHFPRTVSEMKVHFAMQRAERNRAALTLSSREGTPLPSKVHGLIQKFLVTLKDGES